MNGRGGNGGGRIAGALGRWVGRAAVGAALAYGGLQLFARTDWFRTMAENELSRRLGMEMRVGRIRATEALNLKMRDVISVAEGEAGLELRLVRVRWRIFRPRGAPMLESIRVDGWAATFAPDAEGRMQPDVLGSKLEDAMGWAGFGRTGPAGEEGTGEGGARGTECPRIEMRWGTVRVQDGFGGTRATATGLDVLWTAMRPAKGAQVSHLSVEAEEVRIAEGPRVLGLRLELIDTGGRQFLAGLDAKDWGGARIGGREDGEYKALLDAMD